MTEPQVASEPMTSALPPRRGRRGPGPLFLLLVIVLAGVVAITWSALSTGTKPEAQWLRKGAYPCTYPDPHGGAPIAAGMILSSAGAGHYVLQTPKKLRTEVGDYTTRTIEAGQYDLAFTSGPLGGVHGDYVLLNRGNAGPTVSYVVLAGGRFDGDTCTMIP